MDAGQITVTIAEDGAVTLAGVNYRDLRSLFTAASLHYDGLKVVKPLDGLHDAALHENNLESGHMGQDDAVPARCSGHKNGQGHQSRLCNRRSGQHHSIV